MVLNDHVHAPPPRTGFGRDDKEADDTVKRKGSELTLKWRAKDTCDTCMVFEKTKVRSKIHVSAGVTR